tara:strand:- start:10859 stop:11206 length:348 start_codon:yes stop_codon:yes gene_type:complete
MAYKPKAVQDWEDTVRAIGCVITGQNDVQIHHVHGRTYKNNKILIGPWLILPLCIRLHDVHSNDPLNVTHYPKKFGLEYGLQKDIFLDMCDNLENDGIILPFGDDVIESIRNTRK